MEMEADWNRNCSSDIVRGSRITALENRERERERECEERKNYRESMSAVKKRKRERKLQRTERKTFDIECNDNSKLGALRARKCLEHFERERDGRVRENECANRNVK